ncbi:CBS family protein [Cardiosporidium cionae]|uniref:Cystathionine beta-synthase n=1 Tax=Cardiosporidium cionae TaxID=476202 RepID=A0ABQ7J7U8_9APIC|nr:CBS family protein [Cardiosporidium cionae]|eukprot:KAF8820061.1 CBS family protein [Cardiosporidium cionae]
MLHLQEGLPPITEQEFPVHAGFPEEKWNDSKLENAKPSNRMFSPTPPNSSDCIYSSILDAIGNTPMVRLSRFAKHYDLKCELLGKCEFLNAGGSVKDRIGKAMVEDAEARERITQGSTLIEPTSGNTGIGLALAAAIKGYNMVITLPEKMSKEKVNVMKALGAEILRTPTEAAWNSPESHIGLALQLQKAIPDAHILDQYSNLVNPLVHYHNTAEEILRQCDNKLDMIIIAAGTGGTITGIGKKVKERLPNCIVVGVDPKGSILASPDELNDEKRNQPYLVEGIGYDFIPSVLDRKDVDRWIKSDDQESFVIARKAIRLEGLLVGGSSGAVLSCAMHMAKELKEGQRCCVILPDSCRNYMSKFISDDWMVDNGFLEPSQDSQQFLPFKGKTVANLQLHSPITVLSSVSISKVVSLMDSKGIDQIPVVRSDGEIIGVVSEGNIASFLQSGRAAPCDTIEKAMYSQFKKVTLACSLSDLSRMLESHAYVVVVSEQQCHGDIYTFVTKQIIVGVVTRIDLLRFLTQ